MEFYSLSRQIGIDAGHRIMTHGSKCRHIHGHRYVIEAICRAGHLHADGGQTDMVLDFGFLKDEMLRHIDEPCDHGFIACIQDDQLLRMFLPPDRDFIAWKTALQDKIAQDGHCLTTDTALATKLYILPFQPTAECLARHWFGRLSAPVRDRSAGLAALAKVKVWETPNCWAEYGLPD